VLEILLQLTKGISWPQIKFNVESSLDSEDEVSMYQKNQRWQISVLDKFELTYFDKSADNTVVDSEGNIIRDQTLEICSVWYQGIKLNLHTLSQMSNFYPNYRDDFIEYCKQHDIKVDHGPLHQTKFWHAGTWVTSFSKDFWTQYKKIRSNNEHNDFVGNSSETIRNNLQRLKESL
jgi:hypothetical protein